jgi:DivIVA domain-containing protein
MTWFFAVLIVLAMGGVAAVAAGQGARLGPSYDDRPDVRLPADRPVTGQDLRGLRFTTAVRGYRASEVDALIDRLAAQLDGHDDQHGGRDEPPRRTDPSTGDAPD